MEVRGIDRGQERLLAITRRYAAASPGPLTLGRASDGAVAAIDASGAVRGLFDEFADAELFVHSLADLRALAAVAVELLGRHRASRCGACSACGQDWPCPTVALVERELS